MNKGALIEALAIARDDFDFDGEHDKAQAVRDYIEQLKEEETHCEECENGTDTPCTACLWEEGAK